MKRSFLMLTGCALMFTACPGGGGDGGATTFTVSGRVTDADGKPLANASVLVLGKTAVTSDATGAFSIADVKTPYDIVAVNGGKQSAIVYKGVTRKDPMLSIPDAEMALGPQYKATVTGKITGARASSSTVAEPEVRFVSASSAITRSTFDTSDSSYAATMDWDGTTSITGSLVALQGDMTSPSSGITKYTGFGRRDNVSLGNGARLTGQDLALQSVSSSTVDATITVPEGYQPFLNSLSMQLSPALSVELSGEPSGSQKLSFPVPVVPQSTFTVSVAAASSPDFLSFSSGVKQGIAAGTTNVTLDLKAAPVPQMPDDKATNVARATQFSWTSSLQGGVNLAVFAKKLPEQPTLAEETPFSITVVTSGSSTELPDLSALGMGLPANTDFTWLVQSVSPIASVDSLLVDLVGSERIPAGQTEFYSSTSKPREFKTTATP